MYLWILAAPLARASADAPVRQDLDLGLAHASRMGAGVLAAQEPDGAREHEAASAPGVKEPADGSTRKASHEPRAAEVTDGSTRKAPHEPRAAEVTDGSARKASHEPRAAEVTDGTARRAPSAPGAPRRSGTRLPGMSGVPAEAGSEDVPLTPATWVAHGGLSLLPLGGLWGASRVGGDSRLGANAAELAAGMLLGSQPAKLLFMRPAAPSRARWMELEVAAFGAGLVLTPPLAALGTWGMGELAFGGSRDRGDAYLGALGGAAAGALLGVAAHALLTKLAGPSSRLEAVRGLIAVGFIGAGATVGYQWAGGGPRPDGQRRLTSARSGAPRGR